MNTNADAQPIEALKETNLNFDLAVIAYTKGSLSAEELWAECDWAATSYERHGLPQFRAAAFARYHELVAD